MKLTGLYFVICFLFAPELLMAQQRELWHDQVREVHYAPEGRGFILKNGNRKFNRALYGTNTGFRVEAGDLPEFALYMPGMGGNFKLGIQNENESKWITEADEITSRYVPGSMEYTIKDKLLGSGSLFIKVLALSDEEGFILKVTGNKISENSSLFWAFGGASGKKFHRDGDIGADPESVFYLQPNYCKKNKFSIGANTFELNYNWDNKTDTNKKTLHGIFPSSTVHIASAKNLLNPQNLFGSKADSLPVIIGRVKYATQNDFYWKISNSGLSGGNDQEALVGDFQKALDKVQNLSSRVEVNTPDPYINTLGGALAMAADAIWESPAYLHGSVAWRMHLNAWRGAYVADPLGWHDRAHLHFESYGNSQVLEPPSGPVVPDTSRNFARQKEEIGTAMFSRGYISRHPNRNNVAHHYDMNLVFIDQLLNHFQWTGDTAFIKKMWPVLKRHLAWEKRNFDGDNDGLYDAYAAIWASDALQYSGGGVTYTSAYNFRANTMAARIASVVNEDPTPYQQEASHIYNALQNILWMPDNGNYAEYQDLLGNRLLHKNPGIWTVYHAMDEGVPDDFQAYQMLDYINYQIPHIPVRAKGLEKDDLYLLSTSNWQPYTWSVNNVALAEVLHTALAFWQGNRPEIAYKIWESAIIESMYLGASPGGFQQLSFYDAIRGELYRDFADPIGMTARTLVEGLYGIQPDALRDTLTIKPGFPAEWGYASLTVPDIFLDYKRGPNKDTYHIKPAFPTEMHLRLEINVPSEAVESVTLNGNKINWKFKKNVVGRPKLIIESKHEREYTIQITWQGKALEKPELRGVYSPGDEVVIKTDKTEITEVNDPQAIFKDLEIKPNRFSAIIGEGEGKKTFFIKMKQGEMQWWHPVTIDIQPQIQIVSNRIEDEKVIFTLNNHGKKAFEGTMIINSGEQALSQVISFQPDANMEIKVDEDKLMPGTNSIELKFGNGKIQDLSFDNWDVKSQPNQAWEMIDISSVFNSKVTDIFENKYLSPRPESPTLQLPTQGIGNWCYPTVSVSIDDSGLRYQAGKLNKIVSPQGVPFQTPGDSKKENIAFISQWDNYPEQIKIPLSGNASHAYLLMAGSTNPMQSRFVNGEIEITYQDGTKAYLELKNPENWWPIEQDYYTDGFAFTTNAPKPPRVYLKYGKITRNFNDFKSIKGFSSFGIEGGAATILDVPLDKKKTLKSMNVRAVANDVVIGLMSVTLAR